MGISLLLLLTCSCTVPPIVCTTPQVTTIVLPSNPSSFPTDNNCIRTILDATNRTYEYPYGGDKSDILSITAQFLEDLAAQLSVPSSSRSFTITDYYPEQIDLTWVPEENCWYFSASIKVNYTGSISPLGSADMVIDNYPSFDIGRRRISINDDRYVISLSLV